MDSCVTERRWLRRTVFNAIMWAGILLYLEIVLHVVLFGGFSVRFFWALGFSAAAGFGVSAVLGLLPTRGAKIVTTVLTVALCILYGAQEVYYYIFGSMFSLDMMALGGGALTSFWKETLLTIAEHILPMLAMLVPIIVTCLLRKKAEWLFRPNRNVSAAVLLILAVGLHFAMVWSLRLGGTGFYTPYSYYHGSDATTERATDNFGLLTAFRLEAKSILFGKEEETVYFVPSQDEDEEQSSDENTSVDYGYNVLDIDFDELNSMTEDSRIKALNDYCASLEGTSKNEYTGMLSDYNLIVLCGESFSTAALDPELTPTLWRMAHEGFVFNNYYNTYPNTTTDGEYSLCQGLLPDKTRGKIAPSFYASRNSYLPMCLGNIFSQQRGIESYAYHNYLGSYYGRYLTHPNMGYTCKFAGAGMSFTTSWPSSDLEMMEQSIQDYIGQEQFHAYYMTFSGHYKYDLATNPMAQRNYDAVKDLPYSEAAKCYLACNIELDKAMEYLMQQLEDAGVADHTAIVLAGDHFPYGLTDEEYSQLIGHDADYFEQYKDTLIFWVGGMDEPVEVDEYCCNIDILPTILNLWGFDFDSRLLAGTDVFSDGTHVAILADQSFLTDKVWFNANTNTASYQVDENSLPDGYLDNMIRLVKNRFSVSTDILNTAYYNFVFGRDQVYVDTSGWISEEDWNGTGGDEDEETVTPEDGETTPEDETPAEDNGTDEGEAAPPDTEAETPGEE